MTNALIGIVVDESGSMINLRSSTIEGVNEFIESQVEANPEDQTLVSLVTFNTAVNVRYVALDVREVPTFGDPKAGSQAQYQPDGGTALFDAVNTTILGLDAWHAKHPDWEGQTHVVIMTDGQENSSREITKFGLQALMEARKEAGWVFIFMGAGEGAWAQGQQVFSGYTAQNVSYGSNNLSNSRGYAVASASVNSVRSTGLTTGLEENVKI